MSVTQCEICREPLAGPPDYDQICDRCLASLLADPESADEPEQRSTLSARPIYTVQRAFGTGLVASCFGTDGLRATVPRLEPDLYQITAGGAEWGVASVLGSGHWMIESRDFMAGPGYVIV